MEYVRLQYQVKKLSDGTVDRYEARELLHPCDSNKSDKENIDDAFDKACEVGAVPYKQIRWKFVNI